MTPPTLEEWRRWSATHSRSYTDNPIKKHSHIGLAPDTPGNAASNDNITRLIEGNGNTT